MRKVYKRIDREREAVGDFMQSHKPESVYTEQHGAINYLSSEGITRPSMIPKRQLVLLAVIVSIAAAIGAFALYILYEDTVVASQDSRATITANLTRDVSYNIPLVTSLVTLGDSAIVSTFETAGYSIYVEYEESDDDSDAGFELVKFPSDLDYDEALALYETGIGNLSGEEASLLLAGYWSLEVDRSSGINLVIHYVDFSSGDVETAVETAIDIEGFNADTASAIDTDSSGNTYSTGTIDIDGTTYTWRISTIELDEVYSISGLPSDAVYVGIRIYD